MIRFETESSVAIVTIDRPSKMNALTLSMRQHLRDIFAEVRETAAVRSVLLCAAGGRAFSAGADVTELIGNDTRVDLDEITNPMLLNLHNIGKPVICAVNGVAVGLGWSLALASDVVLCSESARFSQIFRNVGLAPDGGATYFLTRAIGMSRTRELVLSARFVSAEEARQLGLVHEVLPDAALRVRAMQLAVELTQGPTLAFSGAKLLFSRAVSPSLEEFLRLEADVQCQLSNSNDHQAALRSLAAGQRPAFMGD